MVREKRSKKDKIKHYVEFYNGEFIEHPNEALFCKYCNCIVDCDKKFVVDKHRRTKRHEAEILKRQNVSTESVPKQSFLTVKNDTFTEKLVKAFLCADIPLNKLNNKEMKNLFAYMGYELIPETTARTFLMNNLAKKNNEFLLNFFNQKKIFICIDESEINGTKYVILLAGVIDLPFKNYVLDVRSVDNLLSVDYNLIYSIIIENLDKYKIPLQNLIFAMSDAASYMTKAFKEITKLHKNFFHVTCLAHLLHNCCMRIKTYYENIDKCISSIKAITIKNKTNSNKFNSIGKPPDVIVTRWTSWLKATIYHSKHFNSIKTIVNTLEDDGILIERAKNSINCKSLFSELVEVSSCYICLVELIKKFEDGKLTLETGFHAIFNIDFKQDSVGLKNYLKKRLSENQIKNILEYNNEEISPIEYAMLKNFNPTSIPVERAFSMLKKMLQSCRNFNTENIYNYFAYYYNSYD